jgi:hypothetical protein
MPNDDIPTDSPQPPSHAVPKGRWRAWIANVLLCVLGFAATWVMMAIILLVYVWLFGPTTIGTPTTPP